MSQHLTEHDELVSDVVAWPAGYQTDPRCH